MAVGLLSDLTPPLVLKKNGMIIGFPFFWWSWFFSLSCLGLPGPVIWVLSLLTVSHPKSLACALMFFHKLGDLGTPSPQVWAPQSFLSLSFVLGAAITKLFHRGPHLTASHFYRSIWMKIPKVPLLHSRHWLDFIMIPSLFFFIYTGTLKIHGLYHFERVDNLFLLMW